MNVRPYINYNAAWISFEDEFEADPEAALTNARALLADPVAVQARLVAIGRARSEGTPSRKDPEDTASLLENARRIGTFGIDGALNLLKIPVERIAKVLSDPAALLLAHQTMMNPEAVPADDFGEVDQASHPVPGPAFGAPGTGGSAPIPNRGAAWRGPVSQAGFTALAASPDHFRTRLGEVMPALTAYLGWDQAGIAGPLGEFITEMAQKLKGRRVRDHIGDWLRDFANRNPDLVRQAVQDPSRITGFDQRSWKQVIVLAGLRAAQQSVRSRSPELNERLWADAVAHPADNPAGLFALDFVRNLDEADRDWSRTLIHRVTVKYGDLVDLAV